MACARPVLAARVDAGSLARACKGTALKQAILSICGTPGAVVCCRVASDGKQSHKVMKAAAKCVDTSRYTACISAFPSVPTGCDANGCVQPSVCDNGVVETGEDFQARGRLGRQRVSRRVGSIHALLPVVVIHLCPDLRGWRCSRHD